MVFFIPIGRNLSDKLWKAGYCSSCWSSAEKSREDNLPRIVTEYDQYPRNLLVRGTILILYNIIISRLLDNTSIPSVEMQITAWSVCNQSNWTINQNQYSRRVHRQPEKIQSNRLSLDLLVRRALDLDHWWGLAMPVKTSPYWFPGRTLRCFL